MRRTGFTLIELLIVVAIIAILAAIAVPNFLEAQVRSKVSRVKNDMRSLATAIESYTVDNTRPPLGVWEYFDTHSVPSGFRHWCFNQLTTPIAYMTGWLSDPFGKFPPEGIQREESKFYYYETYLDDVYPERGQAGDGYHDAHARGYVWAAYSVGPLGLEEIPWLPWMLQGTDGGYTLDFAMGGVYDSTNGTKSKGKIYRTNKGELTGGEIAAGFD